MTEEGVGTSDMYRKTKIVVVLIFQVHLCEVQGFPDSVDVLRHSECKLVVVKTLKLGASESAR
jgi:hypothetical protein